MRRAHRRERTDTGVLTEIESLTAEVRQLRADVARLHAAHTAVHIRHGWMSLVFKDLSTNPHTQYKVHMCSRIPGKWTGAGQSYGEEDGFARHRPACRMSIADPRRRAAVSTPVSKEAASLIGRGPLLATVGC
jgi:hypothetical protein